MIVRTAGNTVYTVIGASQAARFERQPNSYMSEIRQTLINPVHTNELTQKSAELTQKGMHFVDVVVDLTAWYSPPKGLNIDVYA